MPNFALLQLPDAVTQLLKRVLSCVKRYLSRRHRRCASTAYLSNIFRPRLGIFEQYSPRPIRLPKSTSHPSLPQVILIHRLSFLETLVFVLGSKFRSDAPCLRQKSEADDCLTAFRSPNQPAGFAAFGRNVRSMNVVSTLPSMKAGWSKISRRRGIVVFTPRTTNSRSARRMVAIASARVG